MANFDEAMIHWIIQMVREFYMLTGAWPTAKQVFEKLSHQ